MALRGKTQPADRGDACAPWACQGMRTLAAEPEVTEAQVFEGWNSRNG